MLENDELVTEDDAKGDQKINKDGVLQGGEADVADLHITCSPCRLLFRSPV